MAVFNENSEPMPVKSAFNVLIFAS